VSRSLKDIMENQTPQPHESNPRSRPSIEVIETKFFAGVIAEEIRASIAEAIEERGQCTVALAGGSTPSSIYRVIGRPSKDHPVDWRKVHLFLGDERWVPLDDHQSNYRMISETLLAQLTQRRPVMHPLDTSLTSPAEGAKKYAETISGIPGIIEEGAPRFDLILLGVGEDGHTASLFPNDPVLQHTSNAITHAVKHPTDGSDRVTLSLSTICNARRLLFMVKGENKAGIVAEVLESNAPVTKLPATLYRNAKGSVAWFLDTAAGSKLSDSKFPRE
jgi:6-phosphogluconolactonase